MKLAIPLLLLVAAQDGRIDAILREEIEKDRLVGASIAVVRDGRVVHAKGYGHADLEHRVPAKADTVYQIGSVTKQFTAAAILLLQEEDKLGVRDPLSKHFPGYPRGDEITLHHLLTHTSGIPNMTALAEFRKSRREDLRPEQVVPLFRDLPLQFEPGERWAYCNSGYLLLGIVIERVSGKPYGKFLAERIFGPLGMADTRAGSHSALVPNRASGYRRSGKEWLNADFSSLTQPGAAGAIASTVEDLAKWDLAVAAGKLLKPTSWELTFKPVELKGGKTHPYGYGWALGEHRGRKTVSHGGSITGFRSHLGRYVEARLTVIVLVNQDGYDVQALQRRIADLLLAEK